MDKIFEPQIIFLYNSDRKIYRNIFIFFGNEEELKTKKIFELFLYLQKYYNIFLNKDFEIINDHLLLTLNIFELRGYIQNEILKTEDKLVLFSFWENIDYMNRDGSIFTPFVDSNFIKTQEQSILYDIASRTVNNTVICVLEEKYSNNNGICLNGLENTSNIKHFIDKIKHIDLDDKEVEIEVEERNKELFEVEFTDLLEHEIQTIFLYKKSINKHYYDNIYISGDELYYKELIEDDNNKRRGTNYTCVYDKDYQDKIFDIENNVLSIENSLLFDKVLSTTKIQKDLLNQKKNKSNVKIIYNLTFTNNVLIDYEINFFLETTKKTKNIFLDRSKKINIMTSTNHILFSSFTVNYDLFIYLTKMIICTQLYNNFVSFLKLDKKLGNRYFSRYCQGDRNPRNLSLSYNDLENSGIDLSEYINYNNVFFKNKINEGDIYFYKEKESYIMCDTPGLYNIGFISEIFDGYNVCFPCCYKKAKVNTEIFKICSGEKNIKIPENIIEPYIHIFKQYRIIMNKNKIGFLINKLNDVFNSDITSFLQDRYRLKEVDNTFFLKRQQKLSRVNIKKHNNNIFFNMNNSSKPIYYYDNGNDPKKYSNKNTISNMKKYILMPELKKTEQRKKRLTLGISDIYNEIVTMDSFVVINSQNRIELAKKYVVYYINDGEKDFEGIVNIYEKSDLILYIIDDCVYYNHKILDSFYRDKEEFYKNVKIYLIIQNKIHILKSINKLSYMDNIVMEDLDIRQKRLLIDKVLNIDPIILNKKINNCSYSYNDFKINDEIFYYSDNNGTKYMYSMQNINLNENTLGYYITDVLYKKYFDIFYIDSQVSLTQQKKIFLTNLQNFINIDIEFNKTYKENNHKNIIKRVKEFLNPKYINQSFEI